MVDGNLLQIIQGGSMLRVTLQRGALQMKCIQLPLKKFWSLSFEHSVKLWSLSFFQDCNSHSFIHSVACRTAAL